MPSVVLTQPDGDRTIGVEIGMSLLEALHAHQVPTGATCGGTGACGGCRVHVADGSVAELTDVERLCLSPADLRDGVRLACQVRPLTPLHVTLEPARWPTAWTDIPAARLGPRPRPPDAAGLWRGPALGAAVDIGTTHLRISLWDLPACRPMGARRGPNPQAFAGLDVIARLMLAARDDASGQRLRDLVRDAIGGALRDLAAQCACDPATIGRVVLVGNTAMLALFAGRPVEALLDPDTWEQPFDCAPTDAPACAAAWGLAAGATIDVVPALGGFVGSDLAAAVLATGLCDGPPGSVLIDFGTNSEVAVWDGHTLWATSAAGGPAFEGCGLSCGVPAGAGAIHRVTRIPGSTDGLVCRTLGDDPPLGLAGSGLVDAVALLRESGMLTDAGRFVPSRPDGILLGSGRRDIRLRPRDIDVFQRAKAAIAAAVDALLDRAHLPPAGVKRLRVCGAFGRDLSVARAQAVGLLPVVPPGQIVLDEHAALAGCEHLLTAADPGARLRAALPPVRVLNLALDPLYEDRFITHLRLRPSDRQEPWPCSTIS